MKKIEAVLIDLSGTLHIENTATPNAVDALKRLRASKVKIKFVTNTTKESKRVLYQRLVKLGFDISQDEIFTSLSAANDLIKKDQLKPMLIVDDAALEDFSDVTKFDGKPDSVVVGLAPEKFNRPVLNEALRLLLDGGKLVAIHQGRYYKTSSGLSLGPGPFVKLLEYAAGVEARTVGKPNVEFFKAALDDLGVVDPTTAIMIGDDVRDDIDGAQILGLKGCLVQTGKYRSGDEMKISPPPDHVSADFSHAVDRILSQFS
uniref:Haloacid dehalogenase-like hydrolase domain-containing protein 2 n=1 Tax=Lygus hesperus TaxID=30085 RepID=A0A0A9XFX4_LYGHE